jgi:pimeloyl-ACP methyl ester carboxylesterase
MPQCAFGLGIKVEWTPEEEMQLTKMAAAPMRWFDTKEAAIQRYLKISGLSGLVPPDSPIASAGVAEGDQGWRLAADPGTAGVGPPPLQQLIQACRAPIHLGRGETDPLVSRQQLLAFDPAAVDLPSVGHNAMVQNPDAIWRWIDETLR